MDLQRRQGVGRLVVKEEEGNKNIATTQHGLYRVILENTFFSTSVQYKLSYTAVVLVWTVSCSLANTFITENSPS